MFADLLWLALSFARANAALLLFMLGIGAQGAALRVALHRGRAAVPAPIDDCDIIVREAVIAPSEMAGGLPALSMPVEGVPVPTSPELLPGAVRAYRAGTHAGVDLRCERGVPVHAAADGKVLTIEDEPNLPEAQRSALLRECRELGETPPEVLRALHGRRVTLNLGIHDGHFVTASYSHLAWIRSDLEPGMTVRAGEVIGAAGASGTSHAYQADGWGEVHFELRIDGQPLGLGLHPADAGRLYREAFGGGR